MDWETPIQEVCPKKDVVEEAEKCLKKKWLRISGIKENHKSTAWKCITSARQENTNTFAPGKVKVNF